MKTITPHLVALLCAMFLAPDAFAEAFFKRDTQLSLGVFFTDQETNTRFNSDFGIGSEISLEDDLGLDSELSVVRFDGYHRFARRHSIGVSIFDLSRDAVATLEGEIEWQDMVFPISADVATDLDFTVYKLAYMYEFLQRETGYLGATLGVYTMDLGISLALVNDQFTAQASEVTAPLPMLGLRVAKTLGDRSTVFASAELFFAEIDDVEGSLHDISVGIEFRVTDHLALALAYNDVELDVDASRAALQADLGWGYSGALVSFRFGF